MESPQYKVIVSTQAQYALWPESVDPPLGWSEEEVRGSILACLEYIGTVWEERDVDTDNKSFVVIADEDDILSVTVAGEELPSGWRPMSEPQSLSKSLTTIKKAWDETGSLPLQLRSETSAEEEE